MLLQDSCYAIKMIQSGIKGPFTNTCKGDACCKKRTKFAKLFRGPLSDLKQKKKKRAPFWHENYGSAP